MQETRLDSTKGRIAVVTGTHSAGKSTLLRDLQIGKLSDLGIKSEYEDLGFGVIRNDNLLIPIITVPEAARWLADAYGRADFLTTNYSLSFQLNIDVAAIIRIHEAASLGDLFVNRLKQEKGLVQPGLVLTEPVTVSDRASIDGLIYSKLRYPKKNTDIIKTYNGTFPWTGLMREWLKSFADLVLIADHTEVPFEQDVARSEDLDFRNEVAKLLNINYTHFFGQDSVAMLRGDREQRREQVISSLTSLLQKPRRKPQLIPLASWPDVKLLTS